MRKPYVFLTTIIAAAALWLAATNPVLTQGFAGNFDTLGNLRVKIDTAIAAGTNAIGKLAANAGVIIGDVNVVSSTLPTGASTAANQATANGSLSSIDTKLTTLSGYVDTLEALITATNALLTSATAGDDPILVGSLTNTVRTVSSGPAILDSYYCSNPNTTPAYLQIFDASSVTLGTTVPKQAYGIPPNDSGGNLAVMNLTFATAVKVAATTTGCDSSGVCGTTAPAVAIHCNFGKK